MGDRIAVMREGVLQQVGPPREIYDHPVNMFVAGFVGSPTMNFIPVTVQGTTAKASGFEVELPRAPGIEKGIVGLRPEALTEHPTDGHPGLELKVEVVEILGADQFIYGMVGGDAITARVDPDLDVSAGSRLRLGVDTRRIHFFDPVTEAAIF
jgi:multiple sugar transport system ATP-binding protein